MKQLVTLLALSSMLTACGPAAVGGAATGTAALYYDHRNLATMKQDREITQAIIEEYQSNPRVNTAHLNVATINHSTLLVGQARTPEQRAEIEKIAKANPNIKHLYNRIDIAAPNSVKQRAVDSWTTAKVKTNLARYEGLKSSQIKALTENNIVYLMGVVTQSQAKTASEIARHVEGVQKVVQLTEAPR